MKDIFSVERSVTRSGCEGIAPAVRLIKDFASLSVNYNLSGSKIKWAERDLTVPVLIACGFNIQVRTENEYFSD